MDLSRIFMQVGLAKADSILGKGWIIFSIQRNPKFSKVPTLDTLVDITPKIMSGSTRYFYVGRAWLKEEVITFGKDPYHPYLPLWPSG